MRLTEKIGYGLGDTASSMLWKLFSVYLMFFYTDVCGLDAWVVGALFFATRVWDSLFDPVVGLICDRTRSRWGLFRPWLLWGALPFAAMGILTFHMPDASPGGKIAYAAVTYTVMMLIYSLVNVPYASLLGVMSSDPRERTTLASYRMAFAAGGSILTVLLAEPLAAGFAPRFGLQGGWTAAVAIIGALAAGCFLATFAATRERIVPPPTARMPVAASLRDLVRNRPWLILAGAAVCLQIFNAFRESGTVYYFKYGSGGGSAALAFAHRTFTASALFLAVGQLFNIAGIAVTPCAAARFGRRRTLTAALALTALLCLGFRLAERGGFGALLVLQAAISLCVGGVLPLLWALSADVADDAEQRTGRRDTGLIFSTYSMAQKIGWSAGSAATAWTLSLAGFQANAAQGPATLTVIGWFQSLLPALAAAGACLFIVRYPLRESPAPNRRASCPTRTS